MNDEWTKPADRTQVRPVPPSQRSDGADIRRNYNRMIKNQERKITLENEEFFSPEYLEEQKKHILKEITLLKRELKPLTLHYNELLAQKEQILPTPRDVNSSDKTVLISEISEEQKEKQRLEEELSKERRHFSEGTRFRLQYELQTDHKEIATLLASIQQSKQQIQVREEALDSIKQSNLANTIQTQDMKIEQLQSVLQQLQASEVTLKQRALEFIGKSAFSIFDNQKLGSLTKKAEVLGTIKMRKNAELRKKRNEFEKQKQTIVKEIDRRRKKKNEMNYKENWKKNLKIQDIIVTEDDYLPYQPKTAVTRAMSNKLPPLKHKTNQKQNDSDYDYEYEYSDADENTVEHFSSAK